MRKLTNTVTDVVGFEDEVTRDTSRPDGTPRKLLGVSQSGLSGWEPRIGLREGGQSTYRWVVEHWAECVCSGRRAQGQPLPGSVQKEVELALAGAV